MNYGLNDLYKVLDEKDDALGAVSVGTAPRDIGIDARAGTDEDPGILRQALSATGRSFLTPISLAGEVIKPIEQIGLELGQYLSSPKERAFAEGIMPSRIYEKALDYFLPEARRTREEKEKARTVALNALMAIPRTPVAMTTGAMKGMEASGRAGGGLGDILFGGAARAVTEPFEQIKNLVASGGQSFQAPGQEGLVEIAERQGGASGRLAGVLGEAILPLAFGLKGAGERALGRRQIEAGRRYGTIQEQIAARRAPMERFEQAEQVAAGRRYAAAKAARVGEAVEEAAVQPGARAGVAERLEAERARYEKRRTNAKSIAEQKAAEGILKTIGPEEFSPPSNIEVVVRKRPVAAIEETEAERKAGRIAQESAEAERRPTIPVPALWTPEIAAQPREVAAPSEVVTPSGGGLPPEIFAAPKMTATVPGMPTAGIPTERPTATVKGLAQIQREMMAAAGRVHRPEPRLPEGVVGAYPPNAQTILTKFRTDPAVAAHEIGHHIENTLVPQGEFGPHRAFIESLSAEPGPTRFSEGFAEGVRLFVSDRAALESTQAGKEFSGWLKGKLKQKAPELGAALEQAGADLEAHRNATPEARIKANIPKEEPQWRSARQNLIERGYQGVVDSHYALERMAAEAQRRGYRPTAADELALAAREARNLSPILQRWIEGEGPKEGVPSLQAIYRASGDVDTLEAYGVAKRDLELFEKRKIEPGGHSLDDSRQYVAQIEATRPEIVKANVLRKAWNRAALEAYRDAGLLHPDAFARIAAMNEEYIPFYRLLETVVPERGGTVTPGAMKRITGRATGKNAPEILSSSITEQRNLIAQRRRIDENVLGWKVYRLLKETPGSGDWGELLSEGSAKLSKTREALLEAGDLDAIAKETGIAKSYLEGMSKQEMSDIMLSFDHVEAPSAGGRVKIPLKNLAGTMEGLPREAIIAVDPEIWEGMRAATAPAQDLVSRVLRRAGQIKRGAISEQVFGASLLTLKDILTAPFVSRAGAGAFLRQLPGSIVDAFGRGATDVLNDRGLFSGIGKAEAIQSPKRFNAALDRLSRWIGPKASARLEGVTRTAEYRSFLKKKTAEIIDLIPDAQRTEADGIAMDHFGRSRIVKGAAAGGTIVWKPGMTTDAVRIQIRHLAADAAREISGEFARGGADPAVQWLKSVSPFWNQTLQGWRMDVVNMRRGSGVAAKLILGAAIPSLIAWYAGRKDSRVQSMGQAERDANYLIPTPGGVVKIPRPYGVMSLVGAMTERLAGKLYDDDPAFADEVWAMIGHEAERALPVSNPFVQPLVEMGFGRRMDYWTRPLVPESLSRREAPSQTLPSTTGLARGISAIPSALFGPGSAVARKLNPIQVESLIRGFGGTLGTDVSRALDLLTPPAIERPKESILTNLPIARRLVARELQAYPRYVQSMDTTMESLSPIANEQKAIERESGRDSAQAAEHYRRNREVLRKYELLSGYRKDIGRYRKEMTAIEASRLSGEEKAVRMRAFAQKMNELARKGLQRAGE